MFLGLFTFIHRQNTRPKTKLLIDFGIDQAPSVNATVFRLVRSIWQEVVAITSELTSFFFYLIARLMISRLPPTHEEVTSNWILFLPLCEQHRWPGSSGAELMTIYRQQPEGRPWWFHDAGDRNHARTVKGNIYTESLERDNMRWCCVVW